MTWVVGFLCSVSIRRAIPLFQILLHWCGLNLQSGWLLPYVLYRMYNEAACSIIIRDAHWNARGEECWTPVGNTPPMLFFATYPKLTCASVMCTTSDVGAKGLLRLHGQWSPTTIEVLNQVQQKDLDWSMFDKKDWHISHLLLVMHLLSHPLWVTVATWTCLILEDQQITHAATKVRQEQYVRFQVFDWSPHEIVHSPSSYVFDGKAIPKRAE